MKPMAPLAANVRLELTPSDSKSDVLPFTPIRYMWAARHSPFREFANALALPCSDYFLYFYFYLPLGAAEYQHGIIGARRLVTLLVSITAVV